MSITAREIFNDARAFLDEWTDDGSVLPDSDVIDLQSKSVRFINKAQRELSSIGNYFKEFEFAHTPYDNVIDRESFLLDEFVGDDIMINKRSGKKARAYSFEVDGESVIYIEENQSNVWTVLETITVPNTVTDYDVFKGTITPTSQDNELRIRFSGTYFYRIRNVAIFEEPFRLDDLPTYKPYFKVALPEDFNSVNQIIREYTTNPYEHNSNYKWENNNTLLINYNYNGNIRIDYKPVPPRIETIDDVLVIDDLTAEIIAYYVTSKLAPFEMKDLVNFYEQKYNEERRRLEMFEVSQEEIIQDVHFGGGN